VVRGGAVVHGGAYVAPHGYYGGAAYYRPYYAFHPHVSVGFGLWLGYPVPYPYYAYPYAYAAPYPYPYGYVAPTYGYAPPAYGYPAQPYAVPNPSSAYPPSNYPSDGSGSSGQEYPVRPSGQQYPQQRPSVAVQAGGQRSAPGGVSFEITPGTADVFVDGTYMGTAASFGPTSQPLGVTTGRHRIEIRASGFRPMTFDADVTPGQVLPYQGTLQRN
jgi:hypothetical protein